ncbi:unnamed protein product [Echinostoma caproni]|uniref:Uncharacterized protein n=1 Tax=Echinostoma caproni TaxID=27848 RepID=A0A3P8ILR5_9TREM|nr:unnamed protein product [Echinostoma caproni]
MLSRSFLAKHGNDNFHSGLMRGFSMRSSLKSVVKDSKDSSTSELFHRFAVFIIFSWKRTAFLFPCLS